MRENSAQNYKNSITTKGPQDFTVMNWIKCEHEFYFFSCLSEKDQSRLAEWKSTYLDIFFYNDLN